MPDNRTAADAPFLDVDIPKELLRSVRTLLPRSRRDNRVEALVGEVDGDFPSNISIRETTLARLSANEGEIDLEEEEWRLLFEPSSELSGRGLKWTARLPLFPASDEEGRASLM